MILSLSGKSSKIFREIGSNTSMLKYQKKMLYEYISKKELDKIENEYGTSNYQKLKMFSKQAQLIYKQGWGALKRDFKTYQSLKAKEKEGNHLLNQEQSKLKQRMWQELHGIKTLIIIQILPFSGPLLIYYIYVYPTSIPSWFSVDTIHQNYQLLCIQTQQKAVQHFKEHPLNTQNFNLHHMKTSELKALSELFFGHYEDGLTGYNKFKPQNKKQYLFHPSFSRYLIIRNIKKQFQKERYHSPQLKNKSIEQLILEKYHRIINQGQRIVFQPISHHSQDLEKEEGKDQDHEEKKK